MNKKNLLYGCVIIFVLLFLMIIFTPDSKTYQLSEKVDSENSVDYPNEYLPCMYWDGIYYERNGKINAEEVKPDKLGEITEILDLSELPEKNGQSNSQIIPVGAEIYPMLNGKDLAMHVGNVWWQLQRQEEWE